MYYLINFDSKFCTELFGIYNILTGIIVSINSFTISM